MTANRSFFLIDPQGIVRKKWIDREPDDDGRVQRHPASGHPRRSSASADDGRPAGGAGCEGPAPGSSVAARGGLLVVAVCESRRRRPARGGVPPQAPESRRLSLRHEASPLQWPHARRPAALADGPAREGGHREFLGELVSRVSPGDAACWSGSTASSPRGDSPSSASTPARTRAAVRRYATELGLTFPLVLDPDGRINALYGVIGIPTTFVVGRDGRAVAFGVGPREWGSAPARALIEALLAEPASRPARHDEPAASCG